MRPLISLAGWMDACLPERIYAKDTVPAVDWIAGPSLIARGDSNPRVGQEGYGPTHCKKIWHEYCYG
jgi:hypothetical protein